MHIWDSLVDFKRGCESLMIFFITFHYTKTLSLTTCCYFPETQPHFELAFLVDKFDDLLMQRNFESEDLY